MASATKVIRWTARILSILLILLFLIFYLGEGPPDPKSLNSSETAMFAAVFIMMGGLVAAFWREKAGVFLIFTGYVWFTVIEGRLDLISPFVLFPLIGLLYIAVWFIPGRRKRPAS
jgi:hypothetical protein